MAEPPVPRSLTPHYQHAHLYRHHRYHRLRHLLLLLLLSNFFAAPLAVYAKTVAFNIGPQYPIPGTIAHVHPNVIVPASATGNGSSFTPAAFFRTSRSGRLFKVYVTVPAGSYDLHFGFVETRFCRPGGRVMHVRVDGQLKLESYDIFKAANNKCKVSVLETVVQHAVSVVHESPVAIQFSAVSANAPATVSSIRITPSLKYPCRPVTTNARINADHLAHAVPGSYRPVVDRDADGGETVFIDGRGSHTHFSYATGTGTIMYYVWTDVETRQVVSRKPFFFHRFALGTTRLRLTVIDSMCTSDDAETSITVTSNSQPGQYCYIYEPEVSPNNMPRPGNLLTYKRPIAAGVSRTLWTTFPPHRVWRSQFLVRCVFFLNIATPAEASKNAIVSVALAKSGTVKVYKGQDLILDSKKSTKSQPTILSMGMTRFEMVFRRTDLLVKPTLTFLVNGKVPRASAVTHDQAVVLPIVTSLTPVFGAVSGGTQVQIRGYGLYAPLKIYFGSTPVFPNIQGQTGGSSMMTLSVRTPPGPKVGDVAVFAENSRRMRSNSVTFAYDDKCDAIGFGVRRIKAAGASTTTTTGTAKNSTSNNVKVEDATSIVIGADGRLYIGTISGVVNVLEYDPFTFIVKSRCSSEKLVDRRYKTTEGLFSLRSILGITFDPRDDVLKPYVSLSTIFWGRQKQIPYSNKQAWMNGAVVRLKPSTAYIRSMRPWQCLQYDITVVRNLPVSDGDHTVNDLEFTQSGDLLISVGGFTNAGLPSQEISSMWEAYFSGAVVIARLSRGSKFNGTIPYTTPTNARTARPITGYTDVGLYATGTRNLFTLTMTRTGRLLGVDMGPNCEFGDAASTCAQYKEQEAAAKPRIKYLQGLAVVDSATTSKCPRGPGRGDKLLEILPQRFYGHPNLQRAKLRPVASGGECAWVDPLSGKRAGGGQPPSNYMAPLAYFDSAKTGGVEYGSNFFCGRLRGQLILTTNSGQGTWRLPLRDDEDKKRGEKRKSLYTRQTFDLSSNSGIRVVENEFGALLYPQYYEPKGIVVNIAERSPVSDSVALAVTNALPFRHGRKGGTRLRVAGHAFVQGVTVRVAGRLCGILRLSSKLIVCRVPAFTGSVGGNLSVTVSVTSKDGKTRVKLEGAVLYMKV